MKFGKNTLAKKVLTIIVSFVLVMNTGFTQSMSNGCNDFVDEPLTVKYLGEDDDYLLFQVTIKTDDYASSFLQINDGAIGEIYSKKIASHSSTTKFKIEKTNYSLLSFYLVSDRKTFSKSFSQNGLKDMIAVK